MENNIANSLERDIKSNINLADLLNLLIKKKFMISIITVSFAIFSVFYSLSLPNIYQSNALLAPVNEEETMSSKLGSISNIANFSGITLGNNLNNKAIEAIYRINSLEFFSKHFLPNINLQNLIAVNKWDPETGKITYKENLYKSETSEWVNFSKYPINGMPTAQQSYKVYKRILNVSEDSKTKFVTLSIRHQSPEIAEKWLNIIINNINQSMKNETKIVAENSIDFLNNSSKETNVNQIKEAISDLLVIQMQTLMLASSSDDYVFKIIDSPYAPETKSAPSRFLICFFGTLLGVILSIFFVLINYIYKGYSHRN